MPSTAWSSAASSKTMFAALPPSSSVSAIPRPASSRWIALPTSVEPVNATLSIPGCLTSAAPVAPSPVTMLTTPGGSSACRQNVGEEQRRQRRRLGRLEHDRVPARERGRDLPREHQQREVPRDDLRGDAERPRRAVREGVLELVGPARVVEEVRRRERQVDVARLLDRLAAVERLEHGELARALLQDRARCGRGTWRARRGGRRDQPFSKASRAASTASVDVLRPRLRDLGERLLGRGRDGREPVAASAARPPRRRRRARSAPRSETMSRDSGAGAYSHADGGRRPRLRFSTSLTTLGQWYRRASCCHASGATAAGSS